MTFADAALPLGLGIASSVHCAQMCGPIVIAYSLPMASGRGSAHLAYNAGRIATYGLLGAIAGLFGQAVALAGTARALSILAGMTLMVAPFWLSSRPALVQIGGSRVGRLIAAPAARWKLPLGALMGFLPCGLVYAGLVKAAETGSAVDGMLTMLLFGAGTAASLLAVGMLSTFLGREFGPHANRIAAAASVAAGAFLVWRGLMSPAAEKMCHVIRG